MARIAGINIPPNQHAVIGLTAIYGIGRSRAKEILDSCGVECTKKVKDLTDTEFRRVWMFFVDGRTVDESGAAEGVSHQNISKSIGAAMKKMKKLFPDC